MEAIHLSPRKLTREDLLAGFGGSILAHALIVAVALLAPFAGSRKVATNPFWTVNLVSMQEFSPGSDMPPKGTAQSSGSGGTPKSRESSKTSGSESARSEPLVRVKRLHMDEPVARAEIDLKRLEAAEVPKPGMNPQSAANVEKNLEKLIAKPKSPPKPTPIVQQGREEGERSGGSAAVSSQKADQSSAEGGRGTGKGAAGTQAGSGKEGDAGHPQGGSSTGKEGAQVGLARRLYYTEVWNAIRKQWALPEFLKTQKLEVVLVIVVRRDGKVLDMRVEKSSGNDIYDESARRAVKKADPLPRFPDIYSPAQEEIGLRFRPEDLS